MLDLELGDPVLHVKAGGFELGLLMLLRVLAVVLASQIARVGDPRALGAGLTKLHIPKTAARAHGGEARAATRGAAASWRRFARSRRATCRR
nr:hypothetical protein [Kofleriaceae bacterium]